MLNESFASYVAYLALDSIGDDDIWQDFNFRMKLWAYREDPNEKQRTRIADSVRLSRRDVPELRRDHVRQGRIGAQATGAGDRTRCIP